MTDSWRQYQEDAANFFRSIGTEALTDHAIQGVRTTHNIDVYVRSHHVGFDVVWLVECKHWNSRVSKLHVLGLREIVADVGADRGILLSETGFQSGAIEAATLTNVHVTSLATLRKTAVVDITAMRLREVYDRVEACRQRYWNIPKSIRIDCELRPDVGAGGYSGDHVVNFASELIAKTFRGIYPFHVDSLFALVMFGNARQFSSAIEVIAYLDPLIVDLETKLTACETLMSEARDSKRT